MRVFNKQVSTKDAAGSVSIICEETEDMWHVFNILLVGDVVRTTTMRKVTKTGSTGSTKSTKMRLNLTIHVETIDFDTETCTLRLNGKNMEESEHVKMGQYHTLELEMNRKFTLEKDCWDTICLERLQLACDIASKVPYFAAKTFVLAIIRLGLCNRRTSLQS
jgi:protein pelota